jgi:hypothetical protein
MKITSCGIIKNEDRPRVGVISINSINSDYLDELLNDSIDLDFEEAVKDISEQVQRDFEDKPELIEEEIERQIQELSDSCFESNNLLLGDWMRDSEGYYAIDKTGPNGFAASYNRDSGTICVEWSKVVKKCCHTSPCYVMANGDGPCGDLDAEGDSVVAFCLPDKYLNK